jgi:hypothetical protein
LAHGVKDLRGVGMAFTQAIRELGVDAAVFSSREIAKARMSPSHSSLNCFAIH